MPVFGVCLQRHGVCLQRHNFALLRCLLVGVGVGVGVGLFDMHAYDYAETIALYDRALTDVVYFIYLARA